MHAEAVREESLTFENLTVQRVVLHEVFKRRQDGNINPPRHAARLTALSPDAMDVFVQRVTDAMGADQQSHEMTIADGRADSAAGIALSLLGTTDAQFVIQSARFADKLANAQLARNLPGGVLVVFTGTVGAAAHPYVAVIKAEKQSGFREDAAALQFLQDLFLTPAAKLYKMGFFIQNGAGGRLLPEGWASFVYDSHISTNQDGAKYFYETFLGCRFPENSARLTRAFFEHTRTFISGLQMEPEKKDDLLTSLYIYLKVDQAPTIQVSRFSANYLPQDSRDDYRAFKRPAAQMAARRITQ